MPFGYNGKVLRVDLSTQQTEVEIPSEVFYRTYMGGSSLALACLLRELKPATDPLGPENVLVFASSILSGIPMAGMARYTVAARSPLTGDSGKQRPGVSGGQSSSMQALMPLSLRERPKNRSTSGYTTGRQKSGMPLISGVQIQGRARKASEKNSATVSSGWPLWVRPEKTWCAMPACSTT